MNKANLLTNGVTTSLSKRTSLHRVIELVTKYIICIKMAFMLFYSPVISWSILTHNTMIILYMHPAVHETDLNLLISLQSCSFHMRKRSWSQWMLSVRLRIRTLVYRSLSFSTCRFIYTLLMVHVTKRMQNYTWYDRYTCIKLLKRKKIIFK
jgi:hypothetical protein